MEFTVSTTNRTILDSIFVHLEQLSKQSSNPYKLCFRINIFENHTKFERSSNNLKVGVIANDYFVSYILLRLLRIILDDRLDLLKHGFEVEYIDRVYNEMKMSSEFGVEAIEKIRISAKEFMRMLADQEQKYYTFFDLNEKPSVFILNGQTEEKIQKSLYEIDIWNLQKIKKAIYKILPR